VSGEIAGWRTEDGMNNRHARFFFFCFKRQDSQIQSDVIAIMQVI